MTLMTKDPAGASIKEVFKHEFGHLMDLGDRYYKSSGAPYEGWENNIMATAKGGKVGHRNIEKMIERFKMRNVPGAPMVHE